MIQDLRYALRGMRRSPGFTVIAVLALTLGIGANTAVFTVLHGVLLKPLPFPGAEKLFLISRAWKAGPFGPGLGLSDGAYLEYQQNNQSFEEIAAFNPASLTLTGAGDPVRVPAAAITSGFLSVLGVQPAIGRGFERGDEAAILLGAGLWRRRFAADPAIAGREITIDGVARRVAGVMPAGFAFPYDAEAWVPQEIRVQHGNSFMHPVVGRLKAGVGPEQARQELESVLGRIEKDPTMWSRVLPLKDLLVSKIRTSLQIFAGAVAFVLLIACANVANLLLMRSAARRQEIAVRAAMGAGRWRLIRQLLTESLTISLAGGAAGILLALWGVPALLSIAPRGRVPRMDEIHIDWWVLGFTLGVSVVTGLIFGLAPAFESTGRKVRESLSFGGRVSAKRGAWVRNGLAVAEIALAMVLLSGAGLMLKSFLRVSAVDPGFQPESAYAMTVDLPGSRYKKAEDVRAFHARLAERLSAIPGAVAVGSVNSRPMGDVFLVRGSIQTESGRPPKGTFPMKLATGPGYFRAMGIRLLEGRDFFGRDDIDAPRVMIVSQSLARVLWPGQDPIGKRITGEDHPKPQDWMTVVGVVDDIRQSQLTDAPALAAYYPHLQIGGTGWISHMSFVVRTARDAAGVPAAMRAALSDVDRDLPAQSLASMQEIVARTTAEPLFQARLLMAFSLLALVLAAIGVYGVLAYSVAMRTREIGIRMALGADRQDVLGMVLRRTVGLAGAGIVAGLAGSLAATRVLQDLLFEVKATDQATLAGVAVVLGLVAVAAGWIPAVRATRVDPMMALRYE
jgi:putative ABC transport system permease protein